MNLFKIFSHHDSKIAYADDGAGHLSPAAVTLAPGANEVTDDQMERLHADENFRFHLKTGFLRVTAIGPTFEEFTAAGYDPATYPPSGYDARESPGWTAYQTALAGAGAVEPAAPGVESTEGAAGGPVGPAQPSDVVDTARFPLFGETPAKYAARMKAAGLTPLSAENVAFIRDFFNLAPDDQTAYYATLTDDEKALIDAAAPSSAKK